jgi:GTP cyclohydrolase III
MQEDFLKTLTCIRLDNYMSWVVFIPPKEHSEQILQSTNAV